NDYQRGRLYPLYGHAHHAHISLLKEEEITQEILWNRKYLHNYMDVPYPKYRGLFPPEASLNYYKMDGIVQAGIDYVIFPHLAENKVSFTVNGEGDYTYKPFLIKKRGKNVLALPRNFPISQEIWRPITKMKRDALKSQGYILGDYPVFDNEYYGDEEEFPISFAEGVEMYRDILLQELEKAPDGGLLLYIQDLELMDYGDIALDIMEEAWNSILENNDGESDHEKKDHKIKFVTPDRYIDETLANADIDRLPEIEFEKICWAPEIRLILRADGHYPPLGVDGVGEYTVEKSGIYDHPHIFWENGKYYCGIFDRLLDNFKITTDVPVNIGELGDREYDLARESLNTQAVLYLRIMKRACNWGWRPTEGRQKRPCLLGYLLCSVLLRKLREYPFDLVLNYNYRDIPSRFIVGLNETLKVFIDNRLNYLEYGLDKYARSHGEDLSEAYELFEDVRMWKKRAQQQVKDLYEINKMNKGINREAGDNDSHVRSLEELLQCLKDYSQAVYMATDFIQKIWGKCPDPEYLVVEMYHYLYDLYPPFFPEMLDRIDSMTEEDISRYYDYRKGSSVLHV
ncbi:MAG: glycoside hydrolase, partial [Halanaerobiales bacterium]